MKNRPVYRRRRSTAPRRSVTYPGAPMNYLTWAGQKPVKAASAPRKTKGGEA